MNSLILEGEVYTTEDLCKIVGNRMAVASLLESGAIERLARGLYVHSEVPYLKGYFLAAKKYHPEGVVSKGTALFHHGLTNFQPDLIDLDVDRESSYRNSTEIFFFHRTTKINNVVLENFQGVSLPCYSLERTVFEVLSVEKGFGDLAREVAHNFASKPFNAKKLLEISVLFGKKGQRLVDMVFSAKGPQNFKFR